MKPGSVYRWPSPKVGCQSSRSLVSSAALPYSPERRQVAAGISSPDLIMKVFTFNDLLVDSLYWR